MAHETDAALVRRVMETKGLSERGMAAVLEVTQPTVNGILNGGQFLRAPVRDFLRGLLVEQAARARIERDGTGAPPANRDCRSAARAGAEAFVTHARDCATCITRAFVTLAGA